MGLGFSENAIVVSIQKIRNTLVTLLENIPEDKVGGLLSKCRQKFGCGGSIVKNVKSPTIQLQGDQKFNIEKTKSTIFEGFELKMKETK